METPMAERATLPTAPPEVTALTTILGLKAPTQAPTEAPTTLAAQETQTVPRVTRTTTRTILQGVTLPDVVAPLRQLSPSPSSLFCCFSVQASGFAAESSPPPYEAFPSTSSL